MKKAHIWLKVSLRRNVIFKGLHATTCFLFDTVDIFGCHFVHPVLVESHDTEAVLMVTNNITLGIMMHNCFGERGGSVVECRTLEREVGGSKPTAAVLCPLLPESTG